MNDLIEHIAKSNNTITNPHRADGLGEHVKIILFTLAFAEKFNLKFVYTPMKDLDHNQDKIVEIEKMLGFFDYYEHDKNSIQRPLKDDSGRIADLCYSNMDILNCSSIKKAQENFKKNKKYTDYFNPEFYNIAIHIRRSNKVDTSHGENKLLEYQINLYDDNFYQTLIKLFLGLKTGKKNKIHIYSQELDLNKYDFGDDVIFHLDEDILITFPSMVMADKLITGASTLSYSAALLRDKDVFYLDYLHPPISFWNRNFLKKEISQYFYFNDNNYPINISEQSKVLTCHTFLNNGKLWENDTMYAFFSKIKKFQESCKDKINIIDIGAQSGLYTLFAKHLDNIHFFSYEPFPTSFELLKENIDLNEIQDKVSPINKAVSNKSEITTLNTCTSHYGLHTLGNDVKRFTDIEKIQVQTITIDEEFFDKQIPVHFIKIDTEGWEFNVLIGGLKTIKKYRPVIQVEWNLENMAQCNIKPEYLTSLFFALNYIETSHIDEDKTFEYSNN